METKEERSINWNKVTPMATLVLAILTAVYVIFVYRIVKTSEKAFYLDSSPKLFIENISSLVKPNFEENSIYVTPIIIVKNGGNTEAENINFTYKLTVKKLSEEGAIGPIKYLFPDQTIRLEMRKFRIKTSEKNMEEIKKAMDMKLKIIIPNVAPFFLDINIGYKDIFEKTREISYSWKYIFHKKIWVFAEMEIE